MNVLKIFWEYENIQVKVYYNLRKGFDYIWWVFNLMFKNMLSNYNYSNEFPWGLTVRCSPIQIFIKFFFSLPLAFPRVDPKKIAKTLYIPKWEEKVQKPSQNESKKNQLSFLLLLLKIMLKFYYVFVFHIFPLQLKFFS